MDAAAAQPVEVSDEIVEAILARPETGFDPDEARGYLDALEKEDARIRAVLLNGLTAATGVIHLSLGGKLFILNGLGYLGLAAARWIAPKNEAWQAPLRDGLIGYTGLSVGAYFIKYGAGGFERITGLATKLIELMLIRTLFADRQAAREKLARVIARAETG